MNCVKKLGGIVYLIWEGENYRSQRDLFRSQRGLFRSQPVLHLNHFVSDLKRLNDLSIYLHLVWLIPDR